MLRNIISQIPNLLTLLNLLCGVLGIYCLFLDKLSLVVYLMIGALLLDFFDGFVARALGAYSEIGKQLDSLADLVSFTVLPSFILIDLYTTSNASNLRFLFLLIPLSGAYRLAKFNTSPENKAYFTGLPTPSIAVFTLGILSTSLNQDRGLFLLNSTFLLISGLILTFLMNSSIKFIAFKNLDSNFIDVFRSTLILLSVVLLFIFGISGLSFVILLYCILSLIKYNFYKIKSDET